MTSVITLDFPVTLKVHYVQGHVYAYVKIIQSLNFSGYKENKTKSKVFKYAK